MARGRKPKPTKLKLIEGNPGKRPINKNEPKPLPGSPEIPTHLSDDARVEWARLCTELAGMGLLSSADRGVIACLAQAWADWIEAMEEIKKSGRFTKCETVDGRTYWDYSPWNNQEKKAKTEILKFSVELGLTPSARSRISTVDRDSGDSLDAILSQGGA